MTEAEPASETSFLTIKEMMENVKYVPVLILIAVSDAVVPDNTE
jgi:hypothetical protein